MYGDKSAGPLLFREHPAWLGKDGLGWPGWLAGWLLVGWLACWLAGWPLASWLAGWLACWLAGRLAAS